MCVICLQEFGTEQDEEADGDAIASRVADVTEPKPTANTVMPAFFSVVAVAMAAEEPPYWELCSPSVRTTAIFRYVVEETLSSWDFADVMPAPMFVYPVQPE